MLALPGALSVGRVSDRTNDLRRFYELLDVQETGLGGAKKLSNCSGRDVWPQRGVYFFREPGEKRTNTGIGPRIVRIGTHALKTGSCTKLWNRLSQHKGVAKNGAGNHRGSIFRLIVGASLIDRDGLDYPTWGKGSSARREIRDGELILEQAVSAEIGDMPFLWLDINDDPGPDSLRGYIERNAIALLSNCGKETLDSPSAGWLGNLCNRKRVRQSGLWNSNHVTDNYDASFLNALETLIKKTAKRP